MDPAIISAIILAFASIIGSGLALFMSKNSSKKELEIQQNLLEEEFKKENLSTKNSQFEVELTKAEELQTHGITEEINFMDVDNLKVFYEKFKTRVDMMEIAKLEIPYQVYYNFAVFKTFVEKSPAEGKFYIDKIQKYDEGSAVPILRWKARINRLCGNEGDAAKLLTELIKLNEIKNNKQYYSRILRSRG
ncbi:MAG: hypothetical protein AAF502_23865, partial [Bacteroidota bacterium]